MIPLRNIKRFLHKAVGQPAYAFSVLLKRAQAQFFYSFGNGKSSFPEAITLFLTHRCNLRCRMCGQWGEGGVTKKQGAQYVHSELSMRELKDLIDDVAGFRPNITLFGGEPLLYPDCPGLIRYIKGKGMHVLMITNGSLLEVRSEDIVESGLDELNVSLDGASELHDNIRGMPGLFNTVINGLKKVNSLKNQKKAKKPLINLQCTINRDNYLDLEQMLDVARLAGADSLTYHNLIFLSPQAIERQKKHDLALGSDSLNWEGFVFEPGVDPEVLSVKINNILKGRYKFNIDLYPNFSRQAILDYYRNPDDAPAGFLSRCLSPWVVAYVFPDGQVRPCLNFSYSYGNIKEEKFTRLWNNPRAVKFRRELKKNKTFAVCGRCTELYRY